VVNIMIGLATRSASISKSRVWAGRIIGGWLVLFIAFDAAVKILNLPVAVEGTTRLGYPAHLVGVIGILELACLIVYVVPRTSIIGAILLTGYLGGATATQVRVENPWFILPVALGGLIWAALSLRNRRSVYCYSKDRIILRDDPHVRRRYFVARSRLSNVISSRTRPRRSCSSC
jgi:hypothetical protein